MRHPIFLRIYLLPDCLIGIDIDQVAFLDDLKLGTNPNRSLRHKFGSKDILHLHIADLNWALFLGFLLFGCLFLIFSCFFGLLSLFFQSRLHFQFVLGSHEGFYDARRPHLILLLLIDALERHYLIFSLRRDNLLFLLAFLLELNELQLIHRLPFCDHLRTKEVRDTIMKGIAESRLCIETKVVCFHRLF